MIITATASFVFQSTPLGEAATFQRAHAAAVNDVKLAAGEAAGALESLRAAHEATEEFDVRYAAKGEAAAAQKRLGEARSFLRGIGVAAAAAGVVVGQPQALLYPAANGGNIVDYAAAHSAAASVVTLAARAAMEAARAAAAAHRATAIFDVHWAAKEAAAAAQKRLSDARGFLRVVGARAAKAGAVLAEA